MSYYTIQVRYTGEGPRQNVWLDAQDPGGLMVIDRHRTKEAAQAEADRLRSSLPQFLDPLSDWELRIVEPEQPKLACKKKRGGKKKGGK